MLKTMMTSCLALLITACSMAQSYYKEAMRTLRPQVIREADWAMKQLPITVTDTVAPSSAGGKHDFYSDGDYWWPDPQNPNGPYIQRDGMTNPGNFVAHRHAMIRLSRIIGALASAYKITGDQRYLRQALAHCRAWFVDTATMMNPNLQFAQAIRNKVTGRGIGIIDTIQLMEVVMGLMAMKESPAMNGVDYRAIQAWFEKYLQWLTTHPYGKEEMNAENNHGTCWAMQVATFARFTGNKELMQFCRDRYRNTFLPGQMAGDGSFPREMKRTKPYGYSIFNLDAMTTLCQVLSTKTDDLWKYQLPDGRSIRKGIEFLYPYVADKSKWPGQHDVMYWDQWPVAQPFLIFGASHFKNKAWLNTWKQLDHDPQNEEVIRNLPVRHVLLWMN